GYVKTYLQESSEGATRKYYKLTEAGRKIEKELKEEWLVFVKKIKKFLEGGEKNE
nr:PadR family transcriptional regulator [Actinomycetota bacterium]